MGGVWERLVRSVRRALLALSNERKMNEDQLRTFLSETESIVKSRPLTPVTLEVDSDLPLTPNHFLKISASSGLPPVAVGSGDSQPRRGWRFVQHVSDQFWRRFSKEYLRTILQPQKWHRLQRNFATSTLWTAVHYTRCCSSNTSVSYKRFRSFVDYRVRSSLKIFVWIWKLHVSMSILGGVYNFLFSALRRVPNNDPLARHNRIVPWQTLELRDDVYAEEYLGAACSFSSGVDLEAGSCVTAKIYI